MRRLVLGLLLPLTVTACRESTPSTRQVVPGGEAERGRALVAQYGCGSCHVIPGIPGAHGGVGPPLTSFAQRSYIAGTLRNEPGSLVRWIRFPQSVEPGTVMPDLGVTEPDARDIAAYLYTLERDGLSPPHLFPSSVLERH